MKRLLVLSLLCAALLTLAACGAAGSDRYVDTSPSIGEAESPAAMGRENAGAVAGSGGTESSRARFQRMLRDGLVRDTDGDLTDGENALYGVYGRQS